MGAAASGMASNSPGLLTLTTGKRGSLSWATTDGHILQAEGRENERERDNILIEFFWKLFLSKEKKDVCFNSLGQTQISMVKQ